MAAAVAGIDLLYATLGLAGVGRLLSGGALRLALGLASAAILVGLGVRTMHLGFRARFGLEAAHEVVEPRKAFATAVAATALNPLTIALWTVSFPAAAPTAARGSVSDAAALLAGAALGTLIWYCGFATAVALLRRRIGPRLLAGIDVLTGLGLVVFGGLLTARTVEDS
jgi:putative LysE/RhtB family amino acid efflux pump